MGESFSQNSELDVMMNLLKRMIHKDEVFLEDWFLKLYASEYLAVE
jgi:hypothetical protein